MSLDRLIETSIEDIARVHAQIQEMERSVEWMRDHRDHLMMLAKFNGARVHDIARACDVSVQTVYQAIERINKKEELEEAGRG